MAKVKLNLNVLTFTEKVQFARSIVTAMTGNGNFTTPVPTLAALTAAANDLEAKSNAAHVKRIAAQTATSLQNDADTELNLKLTQVANYVEIASNGEEAKIASAGIGVRASAAPVGQLPAVQALAATGGDMEGECDLNWQPVPKTRNYVIEKSLDPATATSWQQGGFSTKSRFTVEGLTSGTKYWFRVAAIGTAGQSPWSDPACTMAS